MLSEVRRNTLKYVKANTLICCWNKCGQKFKKIVYIKMLPVLDENRVGFEINVLINKFSELLHNIN
jgi:hypothetical protein